MTQLNPLSLRLPGTWPGLLPNCASEVITTTPPSSTSTFTPCTALSTSKPHRRNRYCLRSPLGFATEYGFTDNPAEAIQLVDHETAARRIIEAGRLDLLPCPVTFELNGDHWHAVAT